MLGGLAAQVRRLFEEEKFEEREASGCDCDVRRDVPFPVATGLVGPVFDEQFGDADGRIGIFDAGGMMERRPTPEVFFVVRAVYGEADIVIENPLKGFFIELMEVIAVFHNLQDRRRR